MQIVGGIFAGVVLLWALLQAISFVATKLFEAAIAEEYGDSDYLDPEDY